MIGDKTIQRFSVKLANKANIRFCVRTFRRLSG
jgi:hypothetical protein